MTIIETTVALMIITISILASAPPLFMASATRLQNSRTEEAMNLAQQEVEKVRLLIENGNYENKDIPASAKVEASQLEQVAPPKLLCFDFCVADKAKQQGDYLVQTFRDSGITQAGVGPGGKEQVVAFRMGVRVYHEASKQYMAEGKLQTQVVSPQLNTGDSKAQFPLAVLYVDFVRGDLSSSLERYRDFIPKK
jgi:type II secretory pathway pseudopilin PulG